MKNALITMLKALISYEVGFFAINGYPESTVYIKKLPLSVNTAIKAYNNDYSFLYALTDKQLIKAAELISDTKA